MFENFHGNAEAQRVLAAAEPGRIRTIDAVRSVAEVAAAIWSEVGPHV